MVLELATISVVAGAVLGRYKVMILVPTITFSVILSVVAGVALTYSFWLIILMIVVLVVAVQVGYVAGMVIGAAAERFQVEPKREADLRHPKREQAEHEAA